MSLKSWKSKPEPKPEPRVLTVPREHLEKILALYDAFVLIDKGDKLAKFHLWSAIEGIFPEVGSGSWKIEIKNAFTFTVVEQFD